MHFVPMKKIINKGLVYMDKIKIGIVGLGTIANAVHIPQIQEDDRLPDRAGHGLHHNRRHDG